MNNRKSTKGRRVQTVLSKPGKILIESHTTKSGDKKNRYRKNPNAKPIKQIRHAPPAPELS